MDARDFVFVLFLAEIKRLTVPIQLAAPPLTWGKRKRTQAGASHGAV